MINYVLNYLIYTAVKLAERSFFQNAQYTERYVFTRGDRKGRETKRGFAALYEVNKRFPVIVEAKKMLCP